MQPYGALDCFWWRSEGGAGGRAESPPACSIRQQLCRKQVPRWGMTRRLRRELGLAVPWGVHTFLSVAKEKCAKESQRHGTTGKSPLLPILTAGLAMSRAMELARLRLLSCALGARLFPPSKWAGLFPSAAYRRSAPPQLAVGILIPCRVGSFNVAWAFCGADKWADFLFPCWRGAYVPSLRVGMFLCSSGILQRKRPAGFQIHAGLFSEP